MILISSHVQEDIETLADEVLVLENGNFVEKFDLHKKHQTYIYRVQTNQPQALHTFLTELQVKFSQQSENWTIFEMNEDKYREFFKEAVAQDIEFYQIKKKASSLNL